MSGLRLNKSRRVSWASDVNLCQFRLFLLDDAPAQVSLGAQDHLQAKTSLHLHSSNRAGPAEALPPGFEGSQSHSSLQIQIDVSQITVIKWMTPPRFLLNLDWQVVSGEESKDVEVQYQRELRVFEAIYPRLSAIPPNAFISSDVDAYCTDEDQAPFIPITPVEEDDVSASMLSDTLAASDVPMNSQPFLCLPGKASMPQSREPSVSNFKFPHEPDVAAVSTAFSAIMKNNEQGNLIDHDLLTKILGNPQLIQQLVAANGMASNMQNVNNTQSIQMAFSDSYSLPISEHTNTFRDAYPQSLGIEMKQVADHRNVPGSISPFAPTPAAASHPIKDLSYYKNLIQKHGEERHENVPHYSSQHVQNPRGNHEMMPNPRLRESKQRIMKPCFFFNSPRGCRNGASCAYLHDEASNGSGNAMPDPDVHSGKRMKLDRNVSS